jgi:hypothetical protein
MVHRAWSVMTTTHDLASDVRRCHLPFQMCSPSVVKDSLKLFFRRLLLGLKLFFRLRLWLLTLVRLRIVDHGERYVKDTFYECN